MTGNHQLTFPHGTNPRKRTPYGTRAFFVLVGTARLARGRTTVQPNIAGQLTEFRERPPESPFHVAKWTFAERRVIAGATVACIAALGFSIATDDGRDIRTGRTYGCFPIITYAAARICRPHLHSLSGKSAMSGIPAYPHLVGNYRSGTTNVPSKPPLKNHGIFSGINARLHYLCSR